MKFRAKVVPSGNATAVEVPAAVMKALGPAARPAVAITVNGHGWRSRVAVMRGRCLVGISAPHRAAAGIAEGDTITVELALDAAPRVVEPPKDLAAALDQAPGAWAAFERLPFGLARKQVAELEGAKAAETRARRIERLVAGLREGRAKR